MTHLERWEDDAARVNQITDNAYGQLVIPLGNLARSVAVIADAIAVTP